MYKSGAHTHTGAVWLGLSNTPARLFQIKELKCNLPNRTQKETHAIGGRRAFKICLCAALALGGGGRGCWMGRVANLTPAALILVSQSQSLLIWRERFARTHILSCRLTPFLPAHLGLSAKMKWKCRQLFSYSAQIGDFKGARTHNRLKYVFNPSSSWESESLRNILSGMLTKQLMKDEWDCQEIWKILRGLVLFFFAYLASRQLAGSGTRSFN